MECNDITLLAEFDPTPSNLRMYYVYILRDKNTDELYYGYTNNLNRRISEHKKKMQDLELIYYEAYKKELDARNRESRLKQYAQALTALKTRLTESLK